MREIVLDVETTGLYPQSGHRIIEVACLELWDHLPTGRMFHRYVNPLMGQMPLEAFEIHQIPIAFLWGQMPFPKIAYELLEFIRDSPIIAHNVGFDVGFINNELTLGGFPILRNVTIDTLPMARQQFKGASNSLDALCRRFEIDLSSRKHHGAAIDCALLAAVYLELIGGRQPLFYIPSPEIAAADLAAASATTRTYRPPRAHPELTESEKINFNNALSHIKEPIWETAGSKAFVLAVPRGSLLDDEIPF